MDPDIISDLKNTIREKDDTIEKLQEENTQLRSDAEEDANTIAGLSKERDDLRSELEAERKVKVELQLALGALRQKKPAATRSERQSA